MDRPVADGGALKQRRKVRASPFCRWSSRRTSKFPYGEPTKVLSSRLKSESQLNPT